jgi:hypothetical protein
MINKVKIFFFTFITTVLAIMMIENVLAFNLKFLKSAMVLKASTKTWKERENMREEKTMIPKGSILDFPAG